MNHDVFITAAYAITAVLIGVLCVTTWRAARHTRKALDEKKNP